MADGQTNDTKPWGEKTQEQIWADYEAAQRDREAYKTALGGVDPEAAKQGWEWARGIAQHIQEGKLKYAEQNNEPPTDGKPPTTHVDEFGLPDNYDELTPREQALVVTKHIQEANKSALAEMVAAEAAKAQEAINGWMGRSEQEKGLLFQVLEASRTNPKLDVKAALEQAARLRASKPEELLQMAIANLNRPDPNANFDERVAAAVAEKLQEAENKRLEAAFGISGVKRKVSLKNGKRSREEVNREILRQWTRAGAV